MHMPWLKLFCPASLVGLSHTISCPLTCGLSGEGSLKSTKSLAFKSAPDSEGWLGTSQGVALLVTLWPSLLACWAVRNPGKSCCPSLKNLPHLYSPIIWEYWSELGDSLNKGPVSKCVKLNWSKHRHAVRGDEGQPPCAADDKCGAGPVLGNVRCTRATPTHCRKVANIVKKGVSGMASCNYWDFSLRFLCHSPWKRGCLSRDRTCIIHFRAWS